MTVDEKVLQLASDAFFASQEQSWKARFVEALTAYEAAKPAPALTRQERSDGISGPCADGDMAVDAVHEIDPIAEADLVHEVVTGQAAQTQGSVHPFPPGGRNVDPAPVPAEQVGALHYGSVLSAGSPIKRAPAGAHGEAIAGTGGVRETLIHRLRTTPSMNHLPADPRQGRSVDEWVSNDRAMQEVMKDAADFLANDAPPIAAAAQGEAVVFPAYGEMPFAELGSAVMAARYGKLESFDFDPRFYPGHQIIGTINFNSLNRIVTWFVKRALATPATTEAEILNRAADIVERLPWHNAETIAHRMRAALSPATHGEEQS